jgi:osmoprotectant transport system permease protein
MLPRVNELGFMSTYGTELLRLTAEHLVLVAVAVVGAGLIGLPLGIGIHQRPRWKTVGLGLVNVVQTIPSLAFFAILIPVPFIGGIGKGTALIALVLYCLLPIVSNTVTGLHAVDPVLREAGIAMGMTERQLLWRVELPLAAGIILAGLRIATVTAVGLATIAAAVGAGGLGMFIFRGLAMLDTRLILAGAIPAALLALLADALLLLLERRISGHALHSEMSL